MSKKIKFVEGNQKNMAELLNYVFGDLVVYLTYDQLNGRIEDNTNDYKYKVKAYNNGSLKVIKYKENRKKSNISIHQKFNLEKHLKMTEKERKKIEEENRKRHIYEVRTKIKDYILNNHFDTFWTLTFDPKICDEAIEDEYRYTEMHKWLAKMRKRHKRRSDENFNYIAIPERHKSGQIHWHMVTGGLDVELIDSGKTYKKQKIYNCPDWEHGFTNVQRMRSKSKISSYVTKYITKDLLYSPVRKNKRKYWSSKGLSLPDVYGVSDDKVMDFMTDENGNLLKPNFSTDVCDIYVLKGKGR
jgi:hypothetical protein